MSKKQYKEIVKWYKGSHDIAKQDIIQHLLTYSLQQLQELGELAYDDDPQGLHQKIIKVKKIKEEEEEKKYLLKQTVYYEWVPPLTDEKISRKSPSEPDLRLNQTNQAQCTSLKEKLPSLEDSQWVMITGNIVEQNMEEYVVVSAIPSEEFTTY